MLFRSSGTACVPLNGGNLYTYVSNTTTPQATCASSQISGGACVTPNTNPVSIGSLGYNAAGSGSAGIWLVPGLVYRFVLKNSAGTTIWTQDGIGLAVVPIASGGTGQTTKAAGFNALSPTSATGDLITYSGGSNIALAAPGAGTKAVLVNAGASVPAWGLLGSGLSITGTTISNSGVTQITSSDSSLTLSPSGGTGVVDIKASVISPVTTKIKVGTAGPFASGIYTLSGISGFSSITSIIATAINNGGAGDTENITTSNPPDSSTSAIFYSSNTGSTSYFSYVISGTP